MTLSKIQQTIWEKARAFGSGDQAVGLTDDACSYIIGLIVHDLGLQKYFQDIPLELPDFFNADDISLLGIKDLNSLELFERLVDQNSDADMYFACLSSLHKARLKYKTILETQPMPTLEQVGPRGLLQYGSLTPAGLTGLLFWRKWFFDIDNRAGQETGYLFEPVIANAVGGVPVPSRISPVKRHADNRKSRQIDCLLGKKAYEIKIRVTIAASGQGRWREELDFPIDCRESGYTPVLIVLDSTLNPKLEELKKAFNEQNGEVYIGPDAWKHLESLAGDTMSLFLHTYIRGPIDDLISNESENLPPFSAEISNNNITIAIGNETLQINRRETRNEIDAHDAAPDDTVDEIPG